ncbi:MAG: LytR C-terminal domain-containing protein [Elusimicrobia bacterium]|nr:LytR C-terminal domain-containing protein [Elusimicrobiota bacterium]
MEQLARIERGLALALLLALGGVAWLESRSELASCIRGGSAWSYWLSLEGDGAAKIFLALYHPARRTLDLVYFPKATAETARAWLASSGLSPAGPVRVERWKAGPPAGLEPPLEAKERFARQSRGLGFLRHLAGLRRQASALPLLDRLLLAIELERLSPDSLRASWLPDTEYARAFLGRLLSGAAPLPAPETVTVEIFNASERKGLASQATKVLRSKGADVISAANFDSRRAKTMIYDRTGRIENAQAARRWLDCPEAETVTQADLKKLIDVTVVLAGDCGGASWN